jgi:nitric oxide reductase subunit B
MKTPAIPIGKIFIAFGLGMLILGLLAGLMASICYVKPDFFKEYQGFLILRPIHVSSVMFWIILGASGCVLYSLSLITGKSLNTNTTYLQLILWFVAIVGIFYSYSIGDLGGREYWEFNPKWSLPIALAWMLFIFNFFYFARHIKRWPVYVWMWMTGILFFMFTFIENYLWMFPYFKSHFINDMTIQWKVNGSLVGSLNQLLYGTAFFLMDRFQKDKSKKIAFSKLAFGMYFLGLANLMFNWGHHIYTLPTENYIRYISYAVSMTEWIFFVKIIYNWKKSIREAKSLYPIYPYRFLIAADFWVFINMGQAVLMSIPILNIYTHGTHVTVAHSMGTTVGINTMILMAACFEFFNDKCFTFSRISKRLNLGYWGVQISLFIFFISLNIAGIKRGLWQLSTPQIPFHSMMEGLKPWMYIFSFAGLFLLIALGYLAIKLLHTFYRCYFSPKEILQRSFSQEL